jgi:hypothetical protein
VGQKKKLQKEMCVISQALPSLIQFSLNIVKGCPDVCSLQPLFSLLIEIVKYVKPHITYSEVNTELESYVFGSINT